MRNLKTFPRGGVHPSDRKSKTEHLSIHNAIIPSTFTVPLLQHLGSPAELAVDAGQTVREGMLIGRATGYVSSPVHSPIPGLVKEIGSIHLPNGVRSQTVVIELQGEFDRLGKPQERFDWETMEAKEILGLISEMGVVGLGGATFPTHVKLSIPRGTVIDTFIVDGVECEPYLTADHRIMLEKPDEIITGIRIVRKILGVERVFIGIEENKPDAIEVMSAAAAGSGLPVEVVPLHLKYPQGDEKQLIKALTGREVPSGGLPLNVGTVVNNVGTLIAIYEAVVFRKPLIERVLTVSGGAVANPMNLKVRIGTPIGQVIEECGGLTSQPERIVVGGPMMGFSLYDLETPVTKGTSGILALTPREVRSAATTACLSCGKCVAACPFGLNPTRLFKMIDHQEYDSAMADGLMDCKECGCCSFVCPAHIPLVQGMKLGKTIARKKAKGSK